MTRRRLALVAAIVAVLVASAVALALHGHDGGRGAALAARNNRVDRTVSSLLSGIPQEGLYLGRRTAPFTMEVFLDLEDPTGRWWFRERLPTIINTYVRAGMLRLQYHAFKRNTYWPAVFVNQQTAALAAGTQNKLWEYIDTFFYEQGTEYTRYVTEGYLQGIAGQIPGLDLVRWRADRHTGRREEQTASEDQAARTLGLQVTPAFRIARTGQPMRNLTSRHMIQYAEQHHPIALLQTSDIASAIKRLNHNQPPSPSHPSHPEILNTRLE
jgi:hypothetical protein